MIKVKVSVSWGKQELVHPSYKTYDITWLRETTLRHDAEGGQVDAELKTIFSMVLPICATCKRDGAKSVVGRYLPNGQALLKRLDHARYLIANAERGR